MLLVLQSGLEVAHIQYKTSAEFDTEVLMAFQWCSDGI